MSTPGRRLLDSLRQHLAQVREEAAQVRGDYDALDGRVREFVSDRGQAIVELASLYLPEISQATVAGSLEGIRGELQGILERKLRAQEELRGRLARCAAVVKTSETELAALTERLNALAARRETLEQEVAKRLATDPEFQQLSRQALDAELQLDANEQRVEEVQLEASRKLPAYSGSRLFMYLYRRQYGTPEYTARGFTRRIDSWLARWIGFLPARTGYEFLKRTPELVTAEVEQRRVAFDQLMDQVEASEQQIADAAGLTPVLREGEQVGTERDRLLARLSEEREQSQRVDAELLQLDTRQGRFYQEALQRLTSFLQSTETSVLEQRARQTPEPADDQIVSRIDWLTKEIARVQPEVAELLKRSQGAEARSEGMSFVVRRAEQANIDSDRCTVKAGSDIDRDVEQFLKGGMNAQDLWRAIDSQLHFEPTWIETSAKGAGDLLQHPASQVLLQVLVQAASAAATQASRHAYGGAAERSVMRRERARVPSPVRSSTPLVIAPPPRPSSPPTSRPAPAPAPSRVPQSAPAPAASPPASRRGFSSGRGF
jgi:hypothetical protein